MKYTKFSHKTPHLKGKQHQLDPNVDLKQLVHHSTVQYVDRDADGDVDVYDNPKKKTPDENPIGMDAGDLSKKLIANKREKLSILEEVWLMRELCINGSNLPVQKKENLVGLMLSLVVLVQVMNQEKVFQSVYLQQREQV